MRILGRVGLVLSCAVLAPALLAQTASQTAAHTALRSTPAGGLPPTYASWTDGRTTPGIMVTYGRYRDIGTTRLGVNSVGLTADLGDRWSDRTQLTLGMASCAGCDATIMGGVEFYAEFARTPVNETAGSPVLAVGLQPALGVAHTLDRSPWYWSASLGVPVALDFALGSALRLQPFVAPAAGWGMVTEDGTGGRTLSGVLPMLGGGVGIHGAEVGIHFGVERIFAERASTQWGLGLTYRGPWR